MRKKLRKEEIAENAKKKGRQLEVSSKSSWSGEDIPRPESPPSGNPSSELPEGYYNCFDQSLGEVLEGTYEKQGTEIVVAHLEPLDCQPLEALDEDKRRKKGKY